MTDTPPAALAQDAGRAIPVLPCHPPCGGCFADKHEGHDVGWRHEDGRLYSATCHDCKEMFHRAD